MTTLTRTLRTACASMALAAALTAPARAGTIPLIPQGGAWRYLDTGTNLGTGWQGLAFDDRSWAEGAAPFGYGDGDESTIIDFGPDPTNKHITTYFRHTFVVTNAGEITNLTLRLLRDDGAAVYLNGAEIFRSNLLPGAITADTLASAEITNAQERAFLQAVLAPAPLRNGTNILAVEVHQFSRSDPDLSFDLSLEGGAWPSVITLIRGPYLQRATPTNVLVRWRTHGWGDSWARYGTHPAELTLLATNGIRTNEHELRLDGLLPATRFYYAIGSSNQTLAEGTNQFFVTPPPVGQTQATRIWVLGDSGTANVNARAVRDAYHAFNGGRYTDLWLMLGDNAYFSGFDHEYQAAVFDMYPETLRQSVLWPTLGNHDYYSSISFGRLPYADIFTLPTQAEAGGVASGTELYYSFDYANIHFVCLDSMSSSRLPGSPMLTWLHSDLAQTSQDWIVAFWHHPPYSKGSHDSDWERELIEMRNHALPMLEGYGVDLVLCGHSHSYERSFLLQGHYGRSSTLEPEMILDAGDGREESTGAYRKPAGGLGAGQGAIYAVAGSSGQVSGGPLNHPAMFISLNQLGSLILDIDGFRLEARFLQANGTISDQFTMIKGDFPGGPRPALRIAQAGGEAVVSWPTAVTPFVLEAVPALGSPSEWRPVTKAPVSIGRSNFVWLNTAGSNQLLRLRRDVTPENPGAQ